MLQNYCICAHWISTQIDWKFDRLNWSFFIDFLTESHVNLTSNFYGRSVFGTTSSIMKVNILRVPKKRNALKFCSRLALAFIWTRFHPCRQNSRFLSSINQMNIKFLGVHVFSWNTCWELQKISFHLNERCVDIFITNMNGTEKAKFW